jgi:hypothetical protein
MDFCGCCGYFNCARGTQTSSEPSLQVNVPHPSVLVVTWLLGSNNPTYSAWRFGQCQKWHCAFGQEHTAPTLIRIEHTVSGATL